MPLALAFAWCISFFYPPAFGAAFVVGYWLTNIVGLVLLHRGAAAVLARQGVPYGRKQLARDLVISLLYTALIIVLVKARVLAPLPEYFSGK